MSEKGYCLIKTSRKKGLLYMYMSLDESTPTRNISCKTIQSARVFKVKKSNINDEKDQELHDAIGQKIAVDG